MYQSYIRFTYKLSFLLHSLLENGARMTPKRRSVFSLIFMVNCISKFNLIIRKVTCQIQVSLKSANPGYNFFKIILRLING